jgi:uncharacterized membrane protein
MTEPGYKRLNLLLASAGVLFSGYLSGVRYFSDSCAFSEPCGFFLGHPACYYGFALFATMFGVALLGFAQQLRVSFERYALRTVSFAGMLFAGYMVALDIQNRAPGAPVLGLPTCAYGLIFFAAIFGVSFLRPHATRPAALPLGFAS